jgi:hypothetical protein
LYSDNSIINILRHVNPCAYLPSCMYLYVLTPHRSIWTHGFIESTVWTDGLCTSFTLLARYIALKTSRCQLMGLETLGQSLTSHCFAATYYSNYQSGSSSSHVPYRTFVACVSQLLKRFSTFILKKKEREKFSLHHLGIWSIPWNSITPICK